MLGRQQLRGLLDALLWRQRDEAAIDIGERARIGGFAACAEPARKRCLQSHAHGAMIARTEGHASSHVLWTHNQRL